MFAVSDKHTGPWHNEAETADQALAKGRAMWGSKAMLYVAKVEPLNPADHLPGAPALIGDLREVLVDKHGSGADAVFDDRRVMAALEHYWETEFKDQFTGIIEDNADMDFNVTNQVKVYSPENSVKVGDFK